jgi:hypothetical protein
MPFAIAPPRWSAADHRASRAFNIADKSRRFPGGVALLSKLARGLHPVGNHGSRSVLERIFTMFDRHHVLEGQLLDGARIMATSDLWIRAALAAAALSAWAVVVASGAEPAASAAASPSAASIASCTISR